MTIIPTPLPEVFKIAPTVHKDSRGFFFESFNQAEFERATGITTPFVQDNHSFSNKGVLRGLHIQRDPHAQAKLVRVVRGSVFDVAVDLRKDSPNFGRFVGALLDADHHVQLYIPAGFGHGFLALEDNTVFLYKTSATYVKDAEISVAWNDEKIGIHWPIKDPLLSEKDQKALSLDSFYEII